MIRHLSFAPAAHCVWCALSTAVFGLRWTAACVPWQRPTRSSHHCRWNSRPAGIALPAKKGSVGLLYPLKKNSNQWPQGAGRGDPELWEESNRHPVRRFIPGGMPPPPGWARHPAPPPPPPAPQTWPPGAPAALLPAARHRPKAARAVHHRSGAPPPEARELSHRVARVHPQAHQGRCHGW